MENQSLALGKKHRPWAEDGSKVGDILSTQKVTGLIPGRTANSQLQIPRYLGLYRQGGCYDNRVCSPKWPFAPGELIFVVWRSGKIPGDCQTPPEEIDFGKA